MDKAIGQKQNFIQIFYHQGKITNFTKDALIAAIALSALLAMAGGISSLALGGYLPVSAALINHAAAASILVKLGLIATTISLLIYVYFTKSSLLDGKTATQGAVTPTKNVSATSPSVQATATNVDGQTADAHVESVQSAAFPEITEEIAEAILITSKQIKNGQRFEVVNYPGATIKSFSSQEEAENYVQAIKKAQAVCAEKKFDRLMIPQAERFSLDKGAFHGVLEQKIALKNLNDPKDAFIKECYADKDFTDEYGVMKKGPMKKLLKQLFLCIIENNLSHITYRTIPLTQDNKIVFLEWKQGGWDMGLESIGHEDEGLFRMVPREAKWGNFFRSLSKMLKDHQQSRSRAAINRVF